MNIAVITGAASGIGLALAQVHLQKGITVVMVDKDEATLKSQAIDLNSQYPGLVFNQTCDVRHADEVNQLAQQIKAQFGQVNWLYNNAGIIGQLAPIWALDVENLRQVMDVNLYGMIHMIQAFSPLLFEQQAPSHIINMASLYALCSGSQTAAYAMSKHAVLALSESLYFDLKASNKPIEVSIVFPSFTDTSLLSVPSTTPDAFHEALKSLLTHSRPALDVASHIVDEVEKKRFYILPDKEVKGYCEERSNAIINQEDPHLNNVEKLMNSLRNRKCRS